MNNKIIIAIDAMGGENSPAKNIEGVFLYLKKNNKKKDVFFNLYGDPSLIKKEIDKYNISSDLYPYISSNTLPVLITSLIHPLNSALEPL